MYLVWLVVLTRAAFAVAGIVELASRHWRGAIDLGGWHVAICMAMFGVVPVLAMYMYVLVVGLFGFGWPYCWYSCTGFGPACFGEGRRVVVFVSARFGWFHARPQQVSSVFGRFVAG